MPRRTRSQTQPTSSSASPRALNPKAPRRPGKEKTTELSKRDAARINNRQAQLEEAVGAMSQEMSTIKELLEKLFAPQALTTTRGDVAVEERRAKQQAAKTTTCGKVASGRRTNSQQVPQSRVESTQSAVPSGKKTNIKAGPSRPYNEAISGLSQRSATPPRSQENERT